jgi:signal transduction histidine kinase
MDPLTALAPLDLPNFRTRRYLGDDLCLPLTAFAEVDRVVIRELYEVLQELFSILTTSSEDHKLPNVQTFLSRRDPDHLVSRVQPLGYASHAANPLPLMAKTIHDVRGGGLTPLLAKLQLAKLCGLTADTLNSMFFLARDHLKIMRNALLGLDDAKRQEDLLPKLHGISFIVDKWNQATIRADDRELRIEVDCRQQVDISECCVEFGALDRILYNLLNNACRHSTGETLRLVIFAVPESAGENLRFVLLNEVSAEDRARLDSLDPKTLFATGVSTTGSGYGLAVAAEFVANAFGLSTPAQAVEGGYLGAGSIGGDFAAWFHWPIVAD